MQIFLDMQKRGLRLLLFGAKCLFDNGLECLLFLGCCALRAAAQYFLHQLRLRIFTRLYIVHDSAQVAGAVAESRIEKADFGQTDDPIANARPKPVFRLEITQSGF